MITTEEGMQQLSGSFELRDDGLLYLHLSDGRRFSIVMADTGMVIHDLSWNAYYKGTGSSMTRDQILALTHSDLKPDMQLLCNVFRFMDTAGIPPKRNENTEV